VGVLADMFVPGEDGCNRNLCLRKMSYVSAKYECLRKLGVVGSHVCA
jgi:hypothetical protein